jgi:hypothetical protein
MSFVSTFQNLSRSMKPTKATLKGKHVDKEEKGIAFTASGVLTGDSPAEVMQALCVALKTTVPVSVPNKELLLSDTRTWEGTQALCMAYVAVFGEPASLPMLAKYPTPEEHAEALELFAALAVHAVSPESDMGRKVDNTLAGARKLLAAYRKEEKEAAEKRERERVNAANIHTRLEADKELRDKEREEAAAKKQPANGRK